MKLQDVFRSVPGGAPVSGATVKLYRHSNNSEITFSPAITTNNSGVWTMTLDMNPGPVYWEATDGTTTRRGSSRAYGMAGPLPLYELVYVLQALGDGVVDGALNEFAVSAGSGRVANIASGAALVQGIPVVAYSQQSVTLDTADTSHPRIDTVVIEVTPAGQSEEGKSEIKLVKGTPAASPAAPTLTQSSSVWQHPLADVRINAGSASITSVTSRRVFLLAPGTLTRNPTVQQTAIYSTTTDQTISSTSGQSLNAPVASATLLDGVVYDVVVRGWLLVKGTGTNVSINTYVTSGGVTTSGTAITTGPTGEYVGLSVVQTMTIVGSGQSISCGISARKITSGGTAVYRSGNLLVQAIPRS